MEYSSGLLPRRSSNKRFLNFSTITSLRFLSDRLSALQPWPQPYSPPATSGVVIDLGHRQEPGDFAQAELAGMSATILNATRGSNLTDVTFSLRFAAATAPWLLSVLVTAIGRCDRSRFAGTIVDLAAWWNGRAI